MKGDRDSSLASSVWRRFSAVDWLFLSLITADVIFIGLDQVRDRTALLSDPLFAISRDGGYPEFFGYAKELAAALACFWYAFRGRVAFALPWGLVFAYFLSDDAFKVHETVGALLTEVFRLEASAGLRAQDIGELAVSALAGAALLGFVLLGMVKTTQTGRKLSVTLLNLTFLLAFVGVVLDMAHSMAAGTRLSNILRLAEDGGEMLVMSCMVYYVFRYDAVRDRIRRSVPFEFLDQQLKRVGRWEYQYVGSRFAAVSRAHFRRPTRSIDHISGRP